MEICIELPVYDPEQTFHIKWDSDAEVMAKSVGEEVIIMANKAGLISLARQLLALSQDSVPTGYHLRFDEGNKLGEPSHELIIQKQ